MHIDLKKQYKNCWFEDKNGKIITENPEQCRTTDEWKEILNANEGFVYYHHLFPTEVSEHIDMYGYHFKNPVIRWITRKNVKLRLFFAKLLQVEPTYKPMMSANTHLSEWSMKLAAKMVEYEGIRYDEAIWIVSTACERCINSLLYKYGLGDGYPEYSDEWKRANTSCIFCKKKTEETGSTLGDVEFSEKKRGFQSTSNCLSLLRDFDATKQYIMSLEYTDNCNERIKDGLCESYDVDLVIMDSENGDVYAVGSLYHITTDTIMDIVNELLTTEESLYRNCMVIIPENWVNFKELVGNYPIVKDSLYYYMKKDIKADYPVTNVDNVSVSDEKHYGLPSERIIDINYRIYTKMVFIEDKYKDIPNYVSLIHNTAFLNALFVIMYDRTNESFEAMFGEDTDSSVIKDSLTKIVSMDALAEKANDAISSITDIQLMMDALLTYTSEIDTDKAYDEMKIVSAALMESIASMEVVRDIFTVSK